MTTPVDDVKTMVRQMFGEAAAFLEHPELGPILRKAAEEGWDGSRLAGALQQTEFWKTNADTARKWSILRTLDPATAQQSIAQQTVAVAEFARANGLQYTPEQQQYFAELSIKNGWNGSQLREHLFAREARNAQSTGALDKNISQQYGYLSAYLDDPEVGDLLRRGSREGWTEQQLEIELRKTTFWQKTTDSQRRWDALRAQNPGDAKAQRENRAAEITTLARQLGVQVDSSALGKIADDSMRHGWSPAQIRTAVTAQYEYTSGEPGVTDDFGAAASTSREIRELAGQYLVPVSEPMMEKWTEQIVRGETDMEGFAAYAKEQAKSMFPGMAAAIDKGITVAQYADPYKQIAAKELEMAPEQIDLMDPRYRKMLDQVDAKGNRVSMTLSESAEYLRQMPEWRQTRGANEKAAAVTENLLRKWGAVA